ncbi:hypothetical protein [Hyphococcus luteus]|uniref:Uncharacterized protein n=1 Tax=Hyphococcus luteus TaxID=2058213 RepID=A0A2S7K6Z9_9PROT|nr:hypothetical protein [Marinicaulis flavus]PQA88283.1 hypothetical protein CW354_08265 [Marinicaulis flavus]
MARLVTVIPLAADEPLQPLRIPEGWTVAYNTFCKVDIDHPDAWTLLKESLLQLKHQRRNRLLDLGWYPEGEPDGRFVTQLYEGDFTGTLLRKHETKDRAEIVDVIERVLEEVTRGAL